MKHLFTLLLLFSIAYAQQTHEKCGLTAYEQFLENKYPGFHQAVEATFNTALLHSQNKANLKSTNSTPDTIFRIPVVFHVVYNGATQNIPDSILHNQIDVLNTDYRRLNADTVNTRTIFKSRAADVGFEFFLATIDPLGNPTSGITRTATTATFGGFFGDMDAMKKDSTGGKNAWNTAEYLNIWVCDLSGGLGFASILGFAYPPSTAPNWDISQFPTDPNVEGVAIHYEVIGANNPLSQTGMLAGIADQGRTAVHEVGHYFGLRHIWGDAGNPFTGAPDCDITKDDGFSDTPHMGSNSQAEGCDFSKNTCTNGESPDEPDMVENYMDYSTEACQNMFTKQQADLMRSMAVIGRPDITHILENDTFDITNGTWIVVNGTDTIQITSTNSYTYTAGDEIMILNQNNGITYTTTDNGTLSEGSQAYVKDDATLSTAEEVGVNSVNINAIKLYPNPTSNLINIENIHTINCNNILISDVSGKIIQSEKTPFNNVTINVELLNSGMYFVSFKNNDRILGVKKLHILK